MWPVTYLDIGKLTLKLQRVQFLLKNGKKTRFLSQEMELADHSYTSISLDKSNIITPKCQLWKKSDYTGKSPSQSGVGLGSENLTQKAPSETFQYFVHIKAQRTEHWQWREHISLSQKKVQVYFIKDNDLKRTSNATQNFKAKKWNILQ